MRIGRSLLASLSLFLLACSGGSSDGDDSAGGTDGEAAATFCAEMAESNEGCWTADLDDDCLERYAECGESMLVLESCPVQLSCSR